MADDQPWKIPPIVQELAAGVQEPPRRYVVGEQDRPAVAAAAMPDPIPIIDLSRLSASDGGDEAAKLLSAVQNWGLFPAVGHGMDPGILVEMMAVPRGFFNLADTFRWGLTPDGAYSSASAYGATFFGSSQPLGAKELWKMQAPPKVRFFMWLVLHRRCWTASRRWRKGLQDSNSCILCDQEAETIEHLLLGCSYSREVWQRCLVVTNMQGIITVNADQPIPWWVTERKPLPKLLRHVFDSLFMLVSWCIWKERNGRTFNGVANSTTQLLLAIQSEGQAWAAAGYKKFMLLLERS